MPDQHKIDIVKLEKRVTDLSNALAHLSSAEDLKQLILIIRRPGWTTPAEFIFASGIVESMLAQATALTQLKTELVKGSQAVAAG